MSRLVPGVTTPHPTAGRGSPPPWPLGAGRQGSPSAGENTEWKRPRKATNGKVILLFKRQNKHQCQGLGSAARLVKTCAQLLARKLRKDFLFSCGVSPVWSSYGRDFSFLRFIYYRDTHTAWGRGRGRGRQSPADAPLGPEPHAGLDPTAPEHDLTWKHERDGTPSRGSPDAPSVRVGTHSQTSLLSCRPASGTEVPVTPGFLELPQDHHDVEADHGARPCGPAARRPQSASGGQHAGVGGVCPCAGAGTGEGPFLVAVAPPAPPSLPRSLLPP